MQERIKVILFIIIFLLYSIIQVATPVVNMNHDFHKHVFFFNFVNLASILLL